MKIGSRYDSTAYSASAVCGWTSYRSSFINYQQRPDRLNIVTTKHVYLCQYQNKNIRINIKIKNYFFK